MRIFSKYEEKHDEELQHYDISLLGRQGSAAKDDEEDWKVLQRDAAGWLIEYYK